MANCGALGSWHAERFKIDAVPPRVQFLTPSPDPSGVDPDGRSWRNTTVTIPMVAVDDTFGSDVVYLQGSSLLTFDAEGRDQAQLVEVADPVGNTFAAFSLQANLGGRPIHIDWSAPTLTLTPARAPNGAGWYNADVTWLAQAQDLPALSGVKTLTSPEGLSNFTVVSRHVVTGQIVETREGETLAVSVFADDFAANGVTVVSPAIRIDRSPPVATAVTAPGTYQAPVSVELAATDALSGVDVIRYRLDGGPWVDYTGPFPVASTTSVTFYAIDNADNQSPPETVTYTISVNRPPVCEAATASPGLIAWPPNHRVVPVSILGIVDPDGDPITIAVDSIWQDEPTLTPGTGNTPVDGGILPDGRPWVRAERSGRGDGRVYEIRFTASDGTASCSGTVFIWVPHDRRGTPPVDSGARWNSMTGSLIP